MVKRGEELVKHYDELVIGEEGVDDWSRTSWLKERTDLRPEWCRFQIIEKNKKIKPETISA